MSYFSEWQHESNLRAARGAFADRVNEWREQTTSKSGRPTVADKVRGEALELIAGYAAELEQVHQAKHDAIAHAHAAEVERLGVEKLRDRVRHLEDELAEKRRLVESRKKFEEDLIEVEFHNGYQGWTIGDLEEIAYRLRLGGGTDDTKLEISGTRASAKVTSPDLVRLDRPGSTPAVPEAAPVVVRRGVPVPVVLGSGAALVLLALVLVLLGAI